jgi:putative ABC transport system permease protein
LLRDIVRLRTQVLTIALVVACGVGGFVGSLSAHLSLTALRDAYYDSARFGHVFAELRRAPNSVAERIRSLPGVVDVDTRVTGQVQMSMVGVTESLTGWIVSLPDNPAAGVDRVVLKRGRWVEAADRDGVLIGDAFAAARGVNPGDRLTILLNGRQEQVTVTGIALSPPFVFAAAAGGLHDDSNYAVLWMPRTRLAAAYDMVGAFNHVSLRLERRASVPGAIAELDTLLATYGSTGAYDRADQASNRTLSQEINEQRVFGTVLPGVFLAVAIFLLNVLLTRHIATERSQIAALRALGYEARDVALHYAAFALTIALIGVAGGLIIGAVLGRWMTALYTGFFRFPTSEFTLSAPLAIGGAALAIAVAVFAAASAVRRIAELAPAEAMRPPAPASYRRTRVERALTRQGSSASVTMVVRELQRRPWRAIATVFGLASAAAIIIAGAWWGDAFDNLIEREMYLRDRAQVFLALTTPTSPAALHEIRRLPGVITAEGARVVPVKLSRGHREYRTVITGLDPHSTLHRVLDSEWRDLPLEPGTIVLTDRLAAALDARVGQSIDVLALEGTRQRRTLTLAAISNDYMGMQAYAERTGVARLAGEHDTVNIARVRLDSAARERFLAAAQTAPRIAAVGDKERMVRYFRSTAQRNLLVFAAILSAFATCIAIGVVYNSARIQLAEREWELATLRVVGFTRAEVSAMLLGQLALQLLISIPVGCVLGFALSYTIVELISAEEFRIPMIVSVQTYGIAVGIMLAAAILSALVVRRHVDRLDLIAVLKTRE